MKTTASASEIDADLLPSEQDVRTYRRQGWYISKVLFTADEIDAVAAAADRFYEGARDGTAPVAVKPFLDWKPEYGDDILRMNDHIVFQSDVIRRLALAPIIGAIAARLAGTDEIRLFNSSMAYKPPGITSDKGRVGWHTDRAYWQTCTSDNMLTAWIPFHDCPEESGPISFISGSHLWDEQDPATAELRAGKTFITSDFEGLQRRLEALGRPLSIVPATMAKGQVSFHHCMLFHGSLENRSGMPRRNLIVHMQDGDNRFREIRDGDGNVISYNSDSAARRLPDGNPDYSDPFLFPTIWRADGTRSSSGD